ncbi:possibl zinc metallo-peptidase [bacterium BMS3Abin02]|nr:possibl zinc metallo-peptidase [bacterium BMS3Abin02]GBE21699.1 possibl zinc metallo-peptidase [bacterium BMS3Bbin01]HDK45790.1 metallopeptidase family protein [Actinomycetota bacterium]HDL48822.1 metallopeptidase family protein [Actinomycetota bacterium]
MHQAPIRMSRAEFESVVDAALDEIPEDILDQIENLAVVVEERPPGNEPGLLGLYEGVSLAERGIDYTGYLPDRITIFRLPHLELGLSGSDLRAEIRMTVLHEVAHHLGFDERRLHELGWD